MVLPDLGGLAEHDLPPSTPASQSPAASPPVFHRLPLPPPPNTDRCRYLDIFNEIKTTVPRALRCLHLEHPQLKQELSLMHSTDVASESSAQRSKGQSNVSGL